MNERSSPSGTQWFRADPNKSPAVYPGASPPPPPHLRLETVMGLCFCSFQTGEIYEISHELLVLVDGEALGDEATVETYVVTP